MSMEDLHVQRVQASVVCALNGNNMCIRTFNIYIYIYIYLFMVALNGLFLFYLAVRDFGRAINLENTRWIATNSFETM